MFKKTPARLMVLEYLNNSESPVDAGQIINYLRKKHLETNKVTVYRILGKYRYELKKNHHHHLICTNCGRVQDVEIGVIEKLEKEIQKDKNFRVQSHSLEFFGLCSNCQK
jgi:Fur family ferric uptake transcriptional regulator